VTPRRLVTPRRPRRPRTPRTPSRRTAPGVGPATLDERGSATVVMLGVISAVLMLTVTGLMLGSAVLASHRARAAADLAALAGAAALMRGEPPAEACQLASRVAVANHGRVQLCAVSGAKVGLSVAVTPALAGLGVATARSLAGPDPSRR
jgi:secretion/DNA translocation related TadE-like protein